MKRVRHSHDREDGATAVEYGIMVALIAVVIMGAVFAVGQWLNDSSYQCVNDALDALPNTPACIP